MTPASETTRNAEVQAPRRSIFRFGLKGLFEATFIVGFALAIGVFFDHPVGWGASAGVMVAGVLSRFIPRSKRLDSFPGQLLMLVLFLVGSWPFLAIVWAPLFFVTFICPFIAVTYCVGQRHYWLLGIFLLFSPFTGAMVVAISDYHAGTGRLPPKRSLGDIGPNPERDTRLVRLPWYRPSPMFGDVDDWMFDTPYERMLTSAARLCGPMQGSYSGPYPTEDQAIALLSEKGEHVVSRDGVLNLNGEEVRLRAHYFTGRSNNSSKGVRVGALYEGQCVVLGTRILTVGGQTPVFTGIALYDRETGRRFAGYPPRRGDKWEMWREEALRDLPCNQSHPYKVWIDKVIK